MTRDEVTVLLAYLAEAFPSSRPPAQPGARVDVWHDVLGEFPVTEVLVAARLIAASDDFHPSTARIVSVVVNGNASTGILARARVRRYFEQRALSA